MSDSRIHEADETEVQEPRKRGLFRRGEDGLTTLEWLLIVAAVAGLAALAVVLVTNVVDQTAEQIGGSSARKTAAEVAALKISQDAVEDPPDSFSAVATGVHIDQWNKKMSDYEEKCNRLRITYGDVEDLTVAWHGDAWEAASDVAADWVAALDKVRYAERGLRHNLVRWGSPY